MGLLFSAIENVLNNFQSRLFARKKLDKIPTREPTPEVATEPTSEPATESNEHKKSKLKLQQEFMNEIIFNEKDINDEIFWNYSKYQNPSVLEKYLFKVTQAKNKNLVNNVDNELIDLRNTTNRNEIPANENPKKVLNIVEKIINFN